MIFVSSVFAATLVVGDGGYATIGEAVEVAVDGDTLEIAGGTWAECIDAGKSLTLVGDGSTVLDGTGICDNTITVNDGETLTLSELEIVGSRGLYLYYSTVVAEGVTFRDSGTEGWYGGAIYTYGGALTTTDCSFTGNSAEYGGAAYLYAYTTWTDTSSVFEGNAATASGAGVFAYYDNDLVLSGTQFSSNVAVGNGGGLWQGWYGDTSLDQVLFSSNQAGTDGGGLYLYAVDKTVTVASSVFEGNAAGADGGGLAVDWYPTLAITDTVFSSNTAAQGGGLHAYRPASLEVTRSTFVSNSATSTGGGLLLYVADDAQISHTDFCANSADWAGGASIQWTTTDAVWNSRFVDNRANYAGGLHRYADYAGVVAYNDFVRNTGVEDGGGYYADYGYGLVEGNLFAYTPDGNGAVAEDVYSLANTELVNNGWVDNEALHGGGYFWVADGEDGNVVAEDAGYADTAEGCAYNLRQVRDSALSGMGSYAGPDAPVEDFDGDRVESDVDCDDLDETVYPDADEHCDGIDEDCDGQVDEDAVDAGLYWLDEDGDGHAGGDAVESCTAPAGSLPVDGNDCDDGDPEVHPGAEEIPDDGIDNDCDGGDEVTPPEDDPVVQAEKRNGCSTTSGAPLGLLALLSMWCIRASGRRSPKTSCCTS